VATTTTTDPVPTNNDPGNPNGSTTDPVVIAPDLRTDKRLVGAQLVAGAGFTYEVTVVNDGPSTAQADIVITDTLPSQVAALTLAEYSVNGATAVACSPATTATVTCTVPDDLPVGQSIVVTITGTIQSGVTTFDDNTVIATTTDADPNLGNNDSLASGNLATNADLTVTKSFDDASVEAGATTEFDLVVTNLGPSDAVAVELEDILPAGFTVDSISSPVGTCVEATTTVADDTVDCDLGTIVATAGSNSVTVTVVAAVDPSQPAGPVTNTATVSSSTPDRNPTNTGTDQIDVTRRADLDLAKTVTSPAPPTAVLAGETISYEIVFTNNGPSSAEGSVVGDPLPAGVAIVPSSVLIDGSVPTGGQSCTTAGNILTCDLGEILPTAPDNTVTITYDVDVDADFTGPSVTNLATANSPTPNNTPTSGTTTGVGTEADLELVDKVSNPSTVDAGDDVEYTITVRNNGPSVSRSVVIDDDIPAGVTVQAASLPVGCSIVAGGDVECQLGDLDPGATVSRTFTVTVSPDQLADVTNEASVSSPTTPEPPTGGTPNVDDVVTTVTTSADLVTTKTASPDPAVPGQPITYTISVRNDGPSVARAVDVTDSDAPALLTGTITSGWVNDTATGTCSTAITCSVGDIPPNGVATITISGTVPTGQLANLVNIADATSTGPDATPDPNPPDATDIAVTPVAPVADIGVAKSIDTDPLVPGDPVAFTITISNNGPSDARSVTVTDVIDLAVTNLATTNPDCGFTGQLLECSIDRIEPGVANVVTVDVTGELDPAFLGTLSNTV
ncbi:MAG: hypothetical protein AAFP84_20880, partial [Actinomycetota bacterium]